MSNKFQAFSQIESLLKTEIEILQDMIRNTVEDEEKAKPLIAKVNSLKNISKTMSTIIFNIATEIDNTREQMFHILESIAALEIQKDPKKFQK